MKNILFFLIVLLLRFSSQAQDTTLPSGKSIIYLHSGKVLKNVRLWRTDERKVEYIKDDNLHDVLIPEINFIKCFGKDYVFNDSSKLNLVSYDVIILDEQDSLFCFIKEISAHTIVYNYLGSEERLKVDRSLVKKYLLKGKEEDGLGYISSPKKEIKIATQKETTDTSENIPIYTPKKPEAEYYEMGKADARRDYKGNAAMAGSFVCGIIPVFGWIGASVILAVPPNIDTYYNTLYKTNKQYQAGYKTAARKKKVRKALGGFLTGAFLFIAMIH